MSVMTFPVIDLRRTGRNIEDLRRKSGLSVRQVQEYFGFEYPQAVYKWQHGESLPSVDNLLALAHLLGVGMEELLVYDDQELSHLQQAAAAPASPTVFSSPDAFQPHPTHTARAAHFFVKACIFLLYRLPVIRYNTSCNLIHGS